MTDRPVHRLLLISVVVGLLVSGPVGPVAGADHSPPPDGPPIPPQAPESRWTAPPQSGLETVENELNVTLALSVAPNTTGAVRVRMTVRNPDSVEGLTLGRGDRLTLESMTGFERRDGHYKWDGRTGHPTATYRLAVNRSTSGHLGSGATAVDVGSWAVLSPPQAPVSYDPIATQLEHGQTTVVESYEIDGEGFRTSDFVYLGPHHTYEAVAGEQTIRLVVPRAAEMAVHPRRVLDTLANASRELRIGGRDGTVTGLVAPTTVEWATGGSATGPSTFRVPADAPIRTASNTWIHEYVHTRDAVTTDQSMAWFTEAVATYYAATWPLAAGLTDFGDFRSTLDEGTDDTEVRLADPGTWNYESDYRKGALVLGRLDRRIRAASNGTHTLDDVIRRLQEHDGVVDAETFARTVANVSSPEVGAAARRYVTTTTTPETWSLAEHERHFGYAPARFTYTLAEPRAVGPAWSRGLEKRSSIQLLPSERLVVDGVVRNDGGRIGTYDVTFRTVPGNVSDRRSEDGLLYAGWKRTYSFTVRPEETGEFFALFGAASTDQLSVQVVEPASTVTVSPVAMNPSSIGPGETVTVTATVSNPSSRPARTTLPITVDGKQVANETIVLGGGETSDITTAVVLETAGYREIGVGTATTTIQVGTPTTDESATAEKSTTTAPRGRQRPTTIDGSPEPSTGSGNGPGFGVAVAVLAVTLLATSRRRSS